MNKHNTPFLLYHQ